MVFQRTIPLRSRAFKAHAGVPTPWFPPGARFALLAAILNLSAGPAWSPTSAQGSGAAIMGGVVDRTSGAPLPGAQIRLRGTTRLEVADAQGRFAYTGLSAGQYELDIRAVGYSMGIWTVTLHEGEVVDTLFDVELLTFELSDILVEGRPTLAQYRVQEFERRRAAGRGHFITEEQIETSRPSTLADLLRSIPGVQVTCRAGGCAVRMTRAPRGCAPEYVVDGLPATFSTSPTMSPLGIVAVEVYRSVTETPAEFQKLDTRCGVVVIWTRSGP